MANSNILIEYRRFFWESNYETIIFKNKPIRCRNYDSASCSSQNYAQQYYKWIDANGSTHYTTTPPPKGAKRLDKFPTYGTSTQNPNPPKAQQPQNESQLPSETQSPQSFGQPSTNVASQTPATTAPVQTQTTAPVRVKPNL